ncbi:hypothetical protein CASFOL_012819 [Castilleja foliolosa]|uniref:Bifunctional inhibitor/plant lipid transfer protein/seed storage helical domain-containing protein n=1 Tax=Castilleja foliolosa TaxID=1961234 RepID=A0ABD3DLP7_9LAMI
MALYNNFLLIWISIFLLFSMSSPSLAIAIDSHVQGCSLIGIDLQSCLVPITQQTPFTIGSCCTTLNVVLEAGHSCLCTLFGTSGYPLFSAELQLSFSSCHLSVPSLTHCHASEPKPIVNSPPATAIPLLNEPPPIPSPAPPLLPSNPLLPELKPPDSARGEGFVPLPPKVNEMPLSENFNSSIVDSKPVLNSTPQPMIGIPERWDYVKSGVNVRQNKILAIIFIILKASWAFL